MTVDDILTHIATVQWFLNRLQNYPEDNIVARRLASETEALLPKLGAFICSEEFGKADKNQQRVMLEAFKNLYN
jgi:hypothetical protein